MQSFKNNWLSRWIEYLLLATIPIAGLLTVTLPWSIPAITNKRPSWTLQPPEAQRFMFEKYLIILAVSGIMAMLILWQARCIMRIINRGNPFIRPLVRRFRLIGAECLFLSIVYFVSIFFVTRFFMAVVFITFALVGLILFVFAELFRQAIAYKEENDMTI